MKKIHLLEMQLTNLGLQIRNLQLVQGLVSEARTHGCTGGCTGSCPDPTGDCTYGCTNGCTNGCTDGCNDEVGGVFGPDDLAGDPGDPGGPQGPGES